MRIITGKSRGVKLVTLEGEATRPTSERAKEAVFSMIQFDIEGRSILDLFGGSGQMALEALSRGAGSAVISDCSKKAVEIIKENAKRTRLDGLCTIVCADWKETLARTSEKKFDIVFLDPPYAANLVPEVLQNLISHLKPTSKVICETGNDIIDQIPGCYNVAKTAKYGVAFVTILTIKENDKK